MNQQPNMMLNTVTVAKVAKVTLRLKKEKYLRK